MILQQVSIFLENRAGQLAELTSLLASHGLNLRAINLAETSDYGIARLIVSDSAAAAKILAENEVLATATSVVMAAVPDRPGGLNDLLQLLSRENVNVSYMYSIFGQTDGKANMIFSVKEPEAVDALLKENGFGV